MTNTTRYSEQVETTMMDLNLSDSEWDAMPSKIQRALLDRTAMMEALKAFRAACEHRTAKEVLHTEEGKLLFAAYLQAGKVIDEATGS